jgi:hypothetical protein
METFQAWSALLFPVAHLFLHMGVGENPEVWGCEDGVQRAGETVEGTEGGRAWGTNAERADHLSWQK